MDAYPLKPCPRDKYGHCGVCGALPENYCLYNPGMDKPDGKPTNPKDMVAVSKLPLHLVPDTLKTYAALAFTEGATKYGAYNWRVAGVSASVYLAALERHVSKWRNGEEVDPATKVPHLANAIACLAIILDAQLCGKLTDDRPPSAPMSTLIDSFEGVVKHLQELHKDKKPRHYTIADSVCNHT